MRIARILTGINIFIRMVKLKRKIVVKITQLQLEYIVDGKIKQNKSIRQGFCKALFEQFIKKL